MIALVAAAAAAPNRVDATLGFDDALATLAVGYARDLGPISVGAELAAPLAVLDLEDWRADAFVARLLDPDRGAGPGVRLQGGLQAWSTANETFHAVALGTRLRVEPGWYAERGSLAADVDWRASWLTHLEQSAFYTETYYPAPDGWYPGSGHEVRVGLHGRAAVSGPVWLGASAGWQGNARWAALVPPVYARVESSLLF